MVVKMAVQMEEVRSANIHSCGVDPETGELHVRFRRGKDRGPGSVYIYTHNLGQALDHHVEAIKSAKSPTGYFGEHIKNHPDISFRKVQE